MNVAGLFAGIGGMELGLASAGHQSILLCEIWDPARAVLRHRFPDVDLTRDVAELASLPADVDLLTAGFPCQDLSQAGMTRGIDGSRSGLVSHIFRLVDTHRVPWVLLENVSFMLHLNKGRAMRILTQAFEDRGYRWAYRVVNSLGFLPQRRERVLFLATRTDLDPAGVLLTDEAAPQDDPTGLRTHGHGFYWTEGSRGLGWAPNAIPTLKNGSTVGIPSPPAILLPDGLIVTPDIADAERLQGFPSGWTEAARDAGKASLRWSLVGNAVTVPVANWIGGRLVESGAYDKARDSGSIDQTRWPRAARSEGRERLSVSINALPVWRPRDDLHRFLQFRGKPLSARATAGFLSRARRSSLRFAPGFLESVAAHLAAMALTPDSGSSVPDCRSELLAAE